MQLDNGFQRDLREALLDDIEHQLVGKQNNLAFQFIQRVHETLREYGRRNDYNVEPLIESLGEVEVSRGPRGVVLRIGWEHDKFPFFEFGTSDHTVNGNPVLSFVWEDRHDPPPWVAREFEREGDGFRVFLPRTNPSGMPESRAIREALRWLRRELEAV